MDVPAPVRGDRAGRTVGAVALAIVLAGVILMLAGAARQLTGGGRADPSWGRATHVPARTAGAARAWRIPTAGAGLMMPAVGPDGSVWVGEMNVNKLARLLPARNTVEEFTFPGSLAGTMGVAVDAGGRVWLAQTATNAIGGFDPQTGEYREYPVPTPRSGPSGIAMDARGDVWFTELGAGKIGRFDPVGRTFREYPLPAGDAAPYGLALAPDGTVWFTEFSGHVGKLHPASGAVTEYPVPGRPNVAGIAVDASGRVWTATVRGTLYEVDARTGDMTQRAKTDANFYGVAGAPDGTVWIGNAGGGSVYAYRPADRRLTPYATGTGSGPWWPAVGPDGRVWVALAAAQANALAEIPAPGRR